MTSSLGRVNLRPSERRVVVVIALVLFAVLNVVFVWPYFGQWKYANKDLETANQKLTLWQGVVKDEAMYRRRIAEIRNESPDVPLEDQLFKLGSTIYGEASKDGITISGSPSATTKTNEFFIQQSQKVSFTQTDETNLVNFIFNLGSGESLIRVQSLRIRPEPPARQRLGGDVTLMGSYQRKAPAKASPTATPTHATTATVPPVKPAVTNLASAKPIGSRKPGTGSKGAPTNAPPKSWWGTVKGWFGSPSTNAVAPVSNTATKTGNSAAPKK